MLLSLYSQSGKSYELLSSATYSYLRFKEGYTSTTQIATLVSASRYFWNIELRREGKYLPLEDYMSFPPYQKQAYFLQ
jgi:hypothetical protein